MITLCAVVLIFLGLLFLLRGSFVGIAFGLILLGNGINLTIFAGSKPRLGMFAFVDSGAATSLSNDPVPQALVLTAIVIGFALLGFVVALIRKVAAIGPIDGSFMKEEDADE